MKCDKCKRQMNYSFYIPDKYWIKAVGKKEEYRCGHCILEELGGHWTINEIIKWRDSNIINEQTDEIPEVAIIESVGHLVEESGDRITLARDKIGLEYRGIISIPKENILTPNK